MSSFASLPAVLLGACSASRPAGVSSRPRLRDCRHKDWLRDIMCAEQLWRLFNNKAHTYEVGDGHEPLFNEDFNNILTVYLRPEPPADGGKDRKRGQESKGEGKDGKEAKGGEEATASEACHFREVWQRAPAWLGLPWSVL